MELTYKEQAPARHSAFSRIGCLYKPMSAVRDGLGMWEMAWANEGSMQETQMALGGTIYTLTPQFLIVRVLQVTSNTKFKSLRADEHGEPIR